jgi:hypothetical protein
MLAALSEAEFQAALDMLGAMRRRRLSQSRA